GALGDAGVGGRSQFRPRQIGLEELVGDDEPAAVLAVEQMMPTGKPEIRHAIAPRRDVGRHLYHSPVIAMEPTMRSQRARLERSAIAACALLLLATCSASAQPYPSKSIHIVVPF